MVVSSRRPPLTISRTELSPARISAEVAADEIGKVVRINRARAVCIRRRAGHKVSTDEIGKITANDGGRARCRCGAGVPPARPFALVWHHALAVADRAPDGDGYAADGNRRAVAVADRAADVAEWRPQRRFSRLYHPRLTLDCLTQPSRTNRVRPGGMRRGGQRSGC